MMSTQRMGAQTVALRDPPSVLSYACVGGKFEKQGPLGSCFDLLDEDSFFGEKTWEKAESAMQKKVLQRALETGAMPQEQQDELEALRRVFATGVPTEDEVLRYQTDCRRIAEMEGRKQVQALQKTKPEEQKPRLSGTQLLLLVLGAALLALGCVLLAKANLAAGIALTAAGALALIGAVLLRGKQAREGGCITTSAITDFSGNYTARAHTFSIGVGFSF